MIPLESIRFRTNESGCWLYCLISCFYVGKHGGLDRIAAAAVRRVKQKSDITLVLVLPYHPAYQENRGNSSNLSKRNPT